MSMLSRLYARRIVNINVNIVLAGLLALIPVAVVVELVHTYGFGGRPSQTFTFWEKKLIAAVTLVTDMVADVLFFYVLHWLANHWPKRLPGRELAQTAGDHSAPGYFKDATLVQIERMVLSPLLYGIWLGSQFLLIREGIDPVWATVIGFCIATTCIRTLHTLWMLRNARRIRLAAAPIPVVVADEPRTASERSSHGIR